MGEISHDTDFQDRRRCNARKRGDAARLLDRPDQSNCSEILEIADACQIDPDHLKAPLDEEERSRIEAEDEYTLILVDIPSIEERNGKDWFVTIPMAIITTKDVLITVCLEETPILTAFMDGRVRDFHTFMKTRFILQILYKNATQYLQYLRIIDKKSEVIEKQTSPVPEKRN